MEDDLKVNNIKRKYKIFMDSLQDCKLQKLIFAIALLEKGTINAFKTVQQFWNERS